MEASAPKSTPKSSSKMSKSSSSSLSTSELRKRNPRAFGIQRVVKAERQQRRTSDIRAKRHRLPHVDRQPLVPPPKVVAVVGPPKVGKSTLVRGLVRNFCRTPLREIRGPITVTCNKRQRITLLEVGANDVNAMVDAAKVADIALVLIDASFGFEMEVFEFLSVCQAHGFPRILGVLTHLDQMRNSKALSKTKKNLKHRFWTEVYAGAKLFHISGISAGGDYPKMELHNLARFISVMKTRPIAWRESHPYVLVDRMEDLTSENSINLNPKCDRNVALYGYVRGTALKTDQMVHLAGVGDFDLANVSLLPDPCPLPETRKEKEEEGAKKAKRRRLDERERAIYAPMSGVGGILYDKDAVYIDVPSSAKKSDFDNSNRNDGKALVRALARPDVCVDERLEQSQVQIFSGSKAKISEDEQEEDSENSDNDDESDAADDEEKTVKVKRKRSKNSQLLAEMGEDDEDDVEEDEDDEDEENDEEDEEETHKRKEVIGAKTVISLDGKSNKANSKIKMALAELEDSKSRRRQIEPVLPEDESDDDNNYDDDEDNDDNAEDNKGKEKNLDQVDVMANASRAFYDRLSNTKSLQKIVYALGNEQEEDNNMSDDNDDGDELGGLFRVVREEESKKSSKAVVDHKEDTNSNRQTIGDWSTEQLKDCIRDCFVTGKWKESEDAETVLGRESDEMYGDFEDLTEGKDEQEGDEEDKKTDEDEDAPHVIKDDLTLRKERMEKKRKLKASFDQEYDEGEDKDKSDNYLEELRREVDAQAMLNRQEFEDMDDEMRVHFEGFRSGLYVRLELHSVPHELITHFDPTMPLVAGGVHRAGHEDQMGYLQLRIKKHRWYPKILKNKDPLILSLGWRRFQTIPVFAVTEHNMRRRMLKYTPEHMHCDAFVWAPITPQNSGCVALQSVSGQERNSFRIAATGTVTEIDQTSTVVKKLKLTGTPMKVFKKTAFINGMFHSSLEVAKFEGAAIQSVSGIRGQIKRALSTPDGAFRATFEDKLLMSDIVFVKTWVTVDIPKFYAPVTNLLLPPESKSEWKGMRTVGELRRAHNIQVEPNPDQLYSEVKREKRVFNKLQIPRNLQNDLPFKLKPRHMEKSSKPKERVHVEIGGREKKVRKLMKVLTVINADQKRKLKVDKAKRRAGLEAKQREITEKRMKRQKEARQQVSKIISQREGRKEKGNK